MRTTDNQVGNLNLRKIPRAVIVRAKHAALAEGKTLRQWVLDTILAKLRAK
jgi:hypothetical protein